VGTAYVHATAAYGLLTAVMIAFSLASTFVVLPSLLYLLGPSRGGGGEPATQGQPGLVTMGESDEEATMTTETQNGTALADELVQRIGQTIGDRAKVTAVFGEPIERESITVIPVAKARFGFGGGGGAGGHDGDEGSGGGGGGGAAVSPVGYIEVSEGTARFKRILAPTDFLAVAAAAALTLLAARRLLAG
jgi:uncharacterized spore protein YtfJ